METRTVLCPGIHCGNCTRTIQNELGELAGVDAVEANAESKQVTVTFGTPASWEQISALLAELGFPPSAP
ncbi:MAG: heavy-metal-associated domain-containing protein [Deltaproteobacteria bacterium]|jgi:copper chaperone CopZ|nr:heavy-metal-associated domain-containing protein [Deltaproteobacteria bacterium]MBW2530217.1 heavy-metal-associated domain-containing protein [Deltaproteobacteria bacterium]